MKKHLVLLLCLAAHAAIAQKVTLSGIVQDTTGAALSPATVLLLDRSDSSLINFATTDHSGGFLLKNVTPGEFLLKITFVGYQPYVRSIEGSNANLGIIVMKHDVHQLNEVVVESERAPVTVKKDTIEFNASSFKTVPNAMVEDLLKKLPGIEVDADGTIRAQGEEVERITVDGKNFFTSDPKIATRNLPADAVDKVQVFDKKSDQATFSGIDDGQREKTINLALKEEKRNGAFGNVMVGGGTEDRYQARGSVNKFKKTQQLSVLGLANNVNEQGFGIEEYMNFSGSSRQMMQGGRVRLQIDGDNSGGIPLNFGNRPSGIMSSVAGGLNFNNEFNKKTELTSSYFYNQIDHLLDQDLERINFFNAGNLKFDQQSRQSNHNENHQANLTLDHRLDSMNSIKLTTQGRFNYTDSYLESTGKNVGMANETINESDRETKSSGTTLTLKANALWRHRFEKKGRTLSANLIFNLSETERDGDQESTTDFFAPEERTEVLRQLNDQINSAKTFGGSVSYTEPLGKRRYLEGNYSYTQTQNDADRNVYDVSNGEEEFNTGLSNEYSSVYQYHRGGLNFKTNRTKYNVTVGGSIQRTNLDGDLRSLGASISRSYLNFLPTTRLNYDFAETKHLELNYETSVQEPSVQELQPVVDNSDPLNLYEGNPELRPAYQHNLRLEFTTFDQARFTNFFAFVEGRYIQHAITMSQEITPEQIRISQPVNVSRKKELNSDVTFGFPLEKIKSRISISATANVDQGINILNDVEEEITQQQFGGRVRYDFRYQEIADFGLSANISRQTTAYEFSNLSDQLYFNQTYRVEGNLSFLLHYQLHTSLEYLWYRNQSIGFSQRIPLLNVSLSRFVFKNKSGEIKISGINLMDESIGVSQTSNLNYVERTVSNSLGRFVMLSFTYSLNKHFNPMGMRSGGRMMRIMK
jgi:hypothetical protein